jgi:hypothetical protein
VFEALAVNLTLIGDIGVCLLKGEHLIGETGRMFEFNGDLKGE